MAERDDDATVWLSLCAAELALRLDLLRRWQVLAATLGLWLLL